MADKYLLDGNTPVKCGDLLEWAAAFETTDVHVADKYISGIRVSTVFLGIDHNFLPGGSPLLFETMIFGGEHDQELWRYATREEALKGHSEAVDMVFLEISKKTNKKGFTEKPVNP